MVKTLLNSSSIFLALTKHNWPKWTRAIDLRSLHVTTLTLHSCVDNSPRKRKKTVRNSTAKEKRNLEGDKMLWHACKLKFFILDLSWRFQQRSSMALIWRWPTLNNSCFSQDCTLKISLCSEKNWTKYIIRPNLTLF